MVRDGFIFSPGFRTQLLGTETNGSNHEFLLGTITLRKLKKVESLHVATIAVDPQTPRCCVQEPTSLNGIIPTSIYSIFKKSLGANFTLHVMCSWLFQQHLIVFLIWGRFLWFDILEVDNSGCTVWMQAHHFQQVGVLKGIEWADEEPSASIFAGWICPLC